MKYVLILVFTFTLAINATATAPSNDNLAGAVTLGNFGAIDGTTIGATREPGEFGHCIGNDPLVSQTVWYQWTATNTSPALFAIDNANFDPAIAVYTGTDYPLSTVAINNDSNGNLPYLEFMATAGTTYKIVVGINGNVGAGGTFHLLWEQVDAPTNNNFAQARELQMTSGKAAMTNFNATAELNETPFGTGKSVWASFTNTTGHDLSMTFSTRSSYNTIFDSTLSIWTGSGPGNLTAIVKNDNMPATPRSRVTFLAKAGVNYHVAIDSGGQGQPSDFILTWNITKSSYSSDFGKSIGNSGEVYYDEAADIAVFRPSTGVWYLIDSSDGTFHAAQFGLNGDKPVPADYDGDGRTDLAVVRDVGGTKIWYIWNSFDGSYKVVQFGLTEDKPVPGDFDADGRMDIAVYRPSTGVWYIWKSSDDQYIIRQFGLSDDIPVRGDFKGTGPGTDIAVFRPSNGTWYIFDGVNTIFAPFGQNVDIPVPADYDLDGKTDIAVFRPSNGVWYSVRSGGDIFSAVKWGLAGDIPQPGDYDPNTNDLDDFAVFRPSDGTWYILRSEGFVTQYTQFGLSDDIPVTSISY